MVNVWQTLRTWHRLYRARKEFQLYQAGYRATLAYLAENDTGDNLHSASAGITDPYLRGAITAIIDATIVRNTPRRTI